jgi:hypothetical protein
MTRRFNWGGLWKSGGPFQSTGGDRTIGGSIGDKTPGFYSLSSLAFHYKEWDNRLPPAANFDFTVTSFLDPADQTGTDLRNGPRGVTASSYSALPIGWGVASQYGYQQFTTTGGGDFIFSLEGARGGTSGANAASGDAITGWNHFTANGAAPTGRRHTRGAFIEGTLTMTDGDVITILVGQRGADDPSNGQNPGGGGGTFVTLGTITDVINASDTLLFAAGGGGGYSGDGGSDNYTAGEGQITEAGATTGATQGGSGGNGGASATSLNNSGSGGGYFTNSSSGTTTNWNATVSSGNSQIAYGFRKGGVGAFHGNDDAGGFGGGGAGSAQTGVDDDKGGAGGYSGGAYAFDANAFGGGGGSYIIGSASSTTATRGGANYTQTGSLGVADGNGSVRIRRL